MAPDVEDAANVGPGLPLRFRGLYELFAIVTHQGRSADSGHYIGWVRSSGDKWLCYDDDDVSECTTDDVLRLRGGGDWPMAYLTFYRTKQ
jgi:ubiquitin carboxyl-terminal hydrolase 14